VVEDCETVILAEFEVVWLDVEVLAVAAVAVVNVTEEAAVVWVDVPAKVELGTLEVVAEVEVEGFRVTDAFTTVDAMDVKVVGSEVVSPAAVVDADVVLDEAL
jgi:hypothetical protein